MILRVRNDSGFALNYATRGSVGLDLPACIESPFGVLIPVGGRARFETGVSIELPIGYGAFIKPRSSMTASGIVIPDGTVDTDFRGKLRVILFNLGEQEYVVKHGDRIAQLVVMPVERVSIVEVEELNMTARGESGFGSSGR